MLTKETAAIQSRFSSYCRTGKDSPEGISAGRMQHYRQLIFNVVQDTLENAFPIAHKYLGDDKFRELAEAFFALHPCQSSQIWQLPSEFCTFLSGHYSPDTLPELRLLKDLLLFEWTETEVHAMEDMDYGSYDPEGNIEKELIGLNPEHRLIALSYPVHLCRPSEAREKKGEYYLLVYRERQSGKVQFVNLSVLHVLTIGHILENEPLENIIYKAAGLFRLPVKEVREHLLQFLADLYRKQFVLGTKKH